MWSCEQLKSSKNYLHNYFLAGISNRTMPLAQLLFSKSHICLRTLASQPNVYLNDSGDSNIGHRALCTLLQQTVQLRMNNLNQLSSSVQLDSRAKANFISFKTYNTLKRRPLPFLRKVRTELMFFSKYKLKPRGEVVFITRHIDKVRKAKFCIVKPRCNLCLVGDSCSKILCSVC